jgi:hypothetical protein
VRFGIRLGPFWVSTSTRRRRRGPQGFQGITRGEDGREHRCHHNHRTPEAAQECAKRETRRRDQAESAARRARIERMSPEEYRREAEKDPVYREWLRRHQDQTEAELQRLKAEAVSAPKAYTATLKYPDGTQRVCCSEGHPTQEGAARHAEQIAASQGYTT